MQRDHSKVAVVVTFSFDPTVSVAIFDTEEEAVNFIAEDLEREYLIDCEQNIWSDITTRWVSEDGYEARLTNHFSHGDDITEWRIADAVYSRKGAAR